MLTPRSPLKILAGLAVLLLATLLPALAADYLANPDLRDLQLHMREADHRLHQRLSTLETGRNLILGLLGVTLFALPLTYLYWLKKASQFAEQKLAEVIESRPQALRQLIDERDQEIALRRSIEIGIVSSKLELEGILAAHDFRRLKTFAPEVAHAQDLARFGAVVLDLDRGLDEATALSLIDRQRLDNALVFTTGQLARLRGRCAFANMPVTLYARLLELLKFRRAALARMAPRRPRTMT